ncbi:MAG TPA: PAS domain S-box protein [Bacteroidales bacterium]|nr:PAS domain S-box protein [Bacteroidales bacterium]
MDAQHRKELVFQYTFITVIISFMILMSAVFLGLIISDEASFSWSGIRFLLRDPLNWLLIALAVLLPVSVYFIARKLSKRLLEKQQQLDQELDRLIQINKFSQELAQNNLDADLSLAGDDDVIGRSLLNLRNSLKETNENNLKLRKEEEQRNWIAEGMAHFSEILRNNINDIDQLSFQVVKDLSRYINAVQGGFYMLDDSDQHNRVFNLTSFFAYDRRKFADKQIKWGDGLIGTCALEQKIIHLKNIPESYLSVTSGLGESNPDSILIVPMQYENEIYGVLEFASFGKFEARHVNLIDRVAESVASTLSAAKTNIRTAILLEESKAQTQALSSHEEEMRQNMEELQATQEEATRQAQRFLLLDSMLSQNLVRAEFSAEGKMITANNLFFSKFEYDNDFNIEGKHVSEFISQDMRDEFNVLWKELVADGKDFKGYHKHVTRTCKDLWTFSMFLGERGEDASLNSIMFLAIDTTEEMMQMKRIESINESAGKLGIRLDLDVNGNVLECNHNFIQLFNLSQKDIKSLVIFDLIDPVEHEAFNKQWDALIKGISYSGPVKVKTAGGEEKWLQGVFDVMQNTSHEADRIVFVGHDITRERKLENDFRIQHESLKKLEKLLRETGKEMVAKIRNTKQELQEQFRETGRLKQMHEMIMDDSLDAIVTTGHDNRIIFFNKAAELLFGYERMEVLEKDIGMLFPEKLTATDELLDSFVHPGNHKITGKRKKSHIIDKHGREKPVMIFLARARVDNENSFTAFIQGFEQG